MPDLSLVDLPGITKIPLKGSDHPENIEEITVGLCSKYMSDPRTIILCVVMANVDITTSDAIKLAKKFDPSGERTLCALTKIDLLSKGQDLRQILFSDDVSLRYGYVACLGRSPEDMRLQVTVQQGLENENQFFHQQFPDLWNLGLVGTVNLVNRLSNILGKNIQQLLPDIVKELKEKMEEFNQELNSLGSPMPENPSEKINTVMLMVKSFTEAYESSIKGKYTQVKKEQEKEPIGVAIRNNLISVFRELSKESCLESLQD